MSSRIIGSREYKVMLRAARFEEGEVPRASAGEFWDWLRRVASEAGATCRGELTEIDKRREVRFYDTGDCLLRRSGYVLRERRKVKKKKKKASGVRQYTLKYRHPDRFISQARDMTQKVGAKGTPKFEEDIKAVFSKPYLASLYSFSSKVEVEEPVRQLGAPVGYFGDLGKRLGAHDQEAALVPVGDFTAREIVLVGGELGCGSIAAECALIVWHDASAVEALRPEVVEFSFRYTSGVEPLDGRAVETAFRVFRALQAGSAQDEWIAAASRTKTASVYAKASCRIAEAELD